MNKRNMLKAFTLAELLITLLVIGVIASEVIPAVINNTQEVEFETGLKKVYSDLSEAVRITQVNNGGVINIGSVNSYDSSNVFRNEFCDVMSCLTKATTGELFGFSKYKFYKGTISTTFDSSQYAAATLKNGSILRFMSYSSCNLYGINACGSIIADINGNKTPNMFGKDVYQFFVVRNNGDGAYMLKPAGIQGDNYSGPPLGCVVNSASQDTSAGCTAKRLQDPNNMP